MTNMLAEHIDEVEALAEPEAAADPQRLSELAAMLASAIEQPPADDDDDATYALWRAALLLADGLDAPAVGRIAQRIVRLPRETVAQVAKDVTVFRLLAQQWEHDCHDLPVPLCPAQPVLESVESFLHELYLLKRVTSGARALARGNPDLAWLPEPFEVADREASEALRTTPLRHHLWAVAPAARRLGLGDLIPPLCQVLTDRGDDTTTAGTDTAGRTRGAPNDPAADAAERLSEREARFAGNLMWAAAHGRLVAEDLALTRRLVARNPARWGEASRHALHHDGFPALAYLEKSNDIWTAPPLFRLPPPAIQPHLQLGSPETPQLALPAPGAIAVQRSNLPANIEPESLFVASARVEIAGVDVRVYGDEQGLWCLAERNGGGRKVRCAYAREEATGWHAQIPILQTGRDAGFPRLHFRPGPLRPLLIDPDFPLLDRACSRRAYVITIGESSLRNLLGWELREPAKRLHPLAQEAGVGNGHELVDLLARDDALALPWIAGLPAAEKGPASRGLSTLGDVVRSIADLPADEISGEIATVEALSGDIAPADGDDFVLVPTCTGTSLLAMQVVRCRLAAKFPDSRIRVVTCDAMRQRRDLTEIHCDLPEEPLDAVYDVADAEIARLLVDDAADPVLVVSGGAKWESEAMLDLGADRRLPVAYRFELAARPVVFRWDWMPAEDDRLREEPRVDDEPSSRYLVMSVGISLLSRFSHATKQREPSAADLLAWAEAQPGPQYALCAELTGFEAWRRVRPAGETLHVALVRSRADTQGAYAPGQVSAEVVCVLLEKQGVRVHTADEWDILDLRTIRRAEAAEQMQRLDKELVRPITRCLDEVTRAAEMPDVLASGGQKLAASVLHLTGRVRGCRVYLAPEAEEGQEPELWRVWAPGKRLALQARRVGDSIDYMRAA